MLSNWQSGARKALAALLPQSCQLCGSASGHIALCQPCQADLQRFPAACCPVCALPSLQGQICGACLSEPPHFDATVAALRYAFPLDQLLQHYKYAPHLSLAHLFAALLPSPGVADIVIAVPSTPAHLRQRGFNPALELARPLAQRLGLPLLLDACSRPQDASAQAGLAWKERSRNIRNAFACHADLSGKRILVIDDVMTTGATLNELARTLKRHGAARVENCVVARALKD